jgi:type IV pilus assembly protein PilQ
MSVTTSRAPRQVFGILGALLASFPALGVPQEATPAPAPPAGTSEPQRQPATGASLQDYLSGGEPGAQESSEFIWLDVKDKDLNDILRSISRQVGVNVIADPEVKEKVTIQLDRVEWRNALAVIAKQTNCKLVEVSDRLIRFTQPPSISMEFQDADIKIVLELLAKQSGANIVMASDVQGKVSLSLREVPWREALDTIVQTAGYTIVKAETDSGNEILRVVRPESLKDQLVTEYFPLRYIRPSDPYRAIITDVEKYTLSPFGGQGSSGALERVQTKGGEAKQEFSLEEALRDTLSKEGSLRYDEHTNTFIVKDTKPKIDEMREIIRRVDVRPPQLFVEVKFIATTNGDLLERGILFDDPATPQREGLVMSGRGAAPGSLPASIDPNGLGGLFPFPIDRPDNIIDDEFGDPNPLAVLDFTEVQAFLRLVKDDDNSRIVQEPTLTMRDNKPATIFVGEEVPFAVQKAQQDQNGNVTVTIEENKRSPINVGFTLYLTPHVISNTDMIDLTVIPKVSVLSGTTSPIPGFDRFEFAQEGAVTRAFIDLPRQALQTVVTSLRVHDGHTAVIGGLQTERKREIQTQVPMLSSLPILGNLFTYKRKQSSVESLIILITPHIVKNVGDEDAEYRRTLKRHQDRDYFYKNYEEVSGLPKEEEAMEDAAPAPEAPPSPPAEEPVATPPQGDQPQEN